MFRAANRLGQPQSEEHVNTGADTPDTAVASAGAEHDPGNGETARMCLPVQSQLHLHPDWQEFINPLNPTQL